MKLKQYLLTSFATLLLGASRPRPQSCRRCVWATRTTTTFGLPWRPRGSRRRALPGRMEAFPVRRAGGRRVAGRSAGPGFPRRLGLHLPRRQGCAGEAGRRLAAEPRYHSLLVPKDSPVRSIADLKGRKVAYWPGAWSQQLTLRALEKAGLPKDYVEFVKLMPIDAAAALPRGSIDAFRCGSRISRSRSWFPAHGRFSPPAT